LRGERGQSSFQACISRMNLNFAIRVKFSNNLHEEDERIRGGGDVGETYIISNDLRGWGGEREGWYFLLFIVVLLLLSSIS